MKKSTSILIIVFMVLAIFTQSCSNDNEVFKTDQTLENSNTDSNKQTLLVPDPDCKIKGPQCANPRDVLVYVIDTPGSDWVVTWGAVPTGSMSPYSDYGNNTVVVTFGSNFEEGLLKLTNKVNDCYFEYPISRCETPSVTCNLIGPECALPETTITLTYSTSTTNNPSPVDWDFETSNGITMVSNPGDNPATFYLETNFNGGPITATYGTGSGKCSKTINIPKCNDNTPSCGCPRPIIDDKLCVSGGHPHWRFQAEGISSQDQITWSVNHGTIHTSPNLSYVIIEPNAGSTAGFTVYCAVTRACADGTTKTRTAFYTNYYGNVCGTGTTGFTSTSCSGSGGGIEIEPEP